ncbi:MAG TPA: glycerophosphodiester phosphodiesterase family protein [Pyrinomonadaceae bacterium]|nr:glycerophosphodiester phosphodiesterase family protein [Pyrinomonadaceae bacterium]
MTAPASAALHRWDQTSSSNRGRRHPFFAAAKKPDVIAHRGGNGQWPGETMYAMRQAQAVGCDVLEMDVYLTKDHELILMHDLDIRKTTAGSGLVHNFTLQEITTLRADHRWSPECEPSLRRDDASQHENDLRVPTLREVLQAFPAMRMVIEMKIAPAQSSPVAKLVELITELKMTEQILVASFHAPFMEDFRRRLPQVATSLTLSINDTGKMNSAAAGRLLDKFLSHSSNEQGADALQLPHWLITRRIVEKAKERGLVLHAWTVNTPAAMDRMKALGVDGIITDCPSRLLARLNRFC